MTYCVFSSMISAHETGDLDISEGEFDAGRSAYNDSISSVHDLTRAHICD